jgi:hypothetical protein
VGKPLDHGYYDSFGGLIPCKLLNTWTELSWRHDGTFFSLGIVVELELQPRHEYHAWRKGEIVRTSPRYFVEPVPGTMTYCRPKGIAMQLCQRIPQKQPAKGAKPAAR